MLSYQQTLDWLFSQLPMYQRTGGANYKIDLQKTLDMMAALGHPERKLKYFHVAGTNGKGSTSHMLASVLKEAGYKTGLYTSPHLIDFRERIKVNGQEISEDFVVSFVEENRAMFTELQLSFFEMTVGLALCYFVAENAEVVVLEVGMGGRLDSTNVVVPEVSVITNIGLDHQKFLGDTLELIAKEKAGIIKPNVPVVIGETQNEITEVFQSIAEVNNSELVFADQQGQKIFQTDLKGHYQRKNVKTAVAALRSQSTFTISNEALKAGLLNVVKNTNLLGRWQVLQEEPKLICDTGHNLEGVTEIVQQLSQESFKTLHLVWGMVDDKNVLDVLKILPKAQYYFTQASIPRALPVEKLLFAAHSIGMVGESSSSVETAVESALKNAEHDDLVFVGGSTFVVADLLSFWEKKN
jgi:dihydrofolate synthase/folylpolyglutamate synthase